MNETSPAGGAERPPHTAENVVSSGQPNLAERDAHDTDPLVSGADRRDHIPAVIRDALTAGRDKPPRQALFLGTAARFKWNSDALQKVGLLASTCLVLLLTVWVILESDDASTSPAGSRSGEDRSGSTSDATSRPTDDGDTAPSTRQGTERFQLESLSYEGEPFETIPIEGTYTGAQAGTTLRVQRRQGNRWVDFPLPAATDEDGRFKAYIELGEPGRNRLRIADHEEGVVSDVMVIRIG